MELLNHCYTLTAFTVRNKFLMFIILKTFKFGFAREPALIITLAYTDSRGHFQNVVCSAKQLEEKEAKIID